ncbi:hypothetical protein EON80_05645 [bacterium]|nr:MAG: hypothetical protein EON80_05645 [bacterium]
MSLTLQTTTARVDENGVLHGLEILESLKSKVVQVVVILEKEEDYDDSDLTSLQWHRGLSVLMAPHFQDDPAEDIYTLEDGKPYDATQD